MRKKTITVILIILLMSFSIISYLLFIDVGFEALEAFVLLAFVLYGVISLYDDKDQFVVVPYYMREDQWLWRVSNTRICREGNQLILKDFGHEIATFDAGEISFKMIGREFIWKKYEVREKEKCYYILLSRRAYLKLSRWIDSAVKDNQ